MAFFFAYTQVRSNAQNLGFTCAISFCLNIYYGTLYAYTPEVLPSAHRGTGNGVSIALNRVMGIVSAGVASYVPRPCWLEAVGDVLTLSQGCQYGYAGPDLPLRCAVYCYGCRGCGISLRANGQEKLVDDAANKIDNVVGKISLLLVRLTRMDETVMP